MPPWVWLIIVIVVILIVWWALTRSAETYEQDFEVHHEEEGEEAAVEEEAEPVSAEPEPAPPEEAEAVEAVVEVEPDDLTKIEGIGPKISSLLQAAGIKTFEQLSQADVGKIDEILEANNLGFHNPGSWPEQAKLASQGHWEELQAMQDQLKGGR